MKPDDHLYAGSHQSNALVSQKHLAARWKKSVRTLQRWRSDGYGPAWIHIGGSVLYRESDILAFENRMRRGGGADQ